VKNPFPAMAIDMDDRWPFERIREFYLYQELVLLAAIKRGDRCEARRIINHLLVHIYSAGEQCNELLKGLLLELVVMMSRAALEAGASPRELLGMRFSHLSELAEIDDDKALAAWLRGTLERLFTAMGSQQSFDVPVLVSSSLRFLRQHMARELTRSELARHVGISAGHLTQLLKERTGRSFVELLREVRVQAACALLLQTPKSLAEIATDCGFCDQSYLTHVFKALRGMTPKQYRDSTRSAALNAALLVSDDT